MMLTKNTFRDRNEMYMSGIYGDRLHELLLLSKRGGEREMFD
jgi:hypothetical protein